MLTSRLLKLQDVCLRLLGINLFAGRHCGSVSCNVANMDKLTDGRCSLMITLLALYKSSHTAHCRNPWDNRIARNYLVSYVWNASGVVGVLLFTVCMDTVFCSLTCNLCALFEIAQSQMKRFRGETLSETQTNLRNILTIYQYSLHMSLTLNRLFRPLINMQFLVASLLLCVLSYQLSENLAQLEVLHYAAFTSSILAQIFLYCHCGGHLKEQSQQFAWAIYDSAWFEVTCI
ncbi:PREDICTED: odorant receptor 47a [Drosophila arizonae]|uniref:Odorant receptor 47a n=1 Tax=Drosophila arizonae TaxID=7263 RepID=A0ABM1PRD5_DROAR|nr:PREDICTED: odorant receptor 47a [Drosophila arizonae]